jgi:uncharacterized protein YjbI with pentapeptide repeats
MASPRCRRGRPRRLATASLSWACLSVSRAYWAMDTDADFGYSAAQISIVARAIFAGYMLCRAKFRGAEFRSAKFRGMGSA